jgi:hypothetical protein
VPTLLGVLAAATSIGLTACSFGAESPPYLIEDCERREFEGHSIARVWNEALLDAIRRDVPAPTVHARNLFHTSAGMWDAWAAYDSEADGYFVQEKRDAGDVESAREAAISYTAFRILRHRYSAATGSKETLADLASTMRGLCYRVDFTDADGDSAAALGNRIAAAVVERGRKDGSLEAKGYVDATYEPVNAPLIVAEPGARMRDPNRWQPLALERIVSQNGLPQPGKVQGFVGPHWGHVESFALQASREGLPFDPGPPPRLGRSSAYERAAVDVVRYSSLLDPGDGVTVDVGPGALGASSLGSNDGKGHDANPATGVPYSGNRVLRGDYARALAEYWADGPKSETPPGHWNAIANEVSDTPGLALRIGGAGDEVDRLEWDVKLYLALNGAVHDAAIAAWGVKGHYDSPRPISMIRYLASEKRLPLVPGLVEPITRASSAPGERHSRLADHVGEIAIRAWRTPARGGGVGWMRAVAWVPYQLPTFVTPAFAGYVSGHSTFSRAAAEVLSAFTGDEYFPGGLYQLPVAPGALKIDTGPARRLSLQWATYYDAADAAGISRLYMGIHITPDDLEGRKIGSVCGKQAWSLARRHFDGSARA